MPQQLSPWLQSAYGWEYGEDGWNSGMDENLLKFSFMFDRNIDSITNTLPDAVNGQAHYLTTDNRVYFAVNNIYFSSVVPKWFVLSLKTTGATYQFNGSSLIPVSSETEVGSRLDAVELTVSSLGTAAFEDSSFFVTEAQLDVSVAESAAYTDLLRNNLGSSSSPASAGAFLVGRASRQIQSVAELRTVPGRYAGDQSLLLGWYTTTPGVGDGVVYWDSTSTETDNGGTIFAVAGVATGRWKRKIQDGVWAEWFGAQNNGTDDLGTTTAAVWAAIRSLRTNPTDMIQYIGGPTVTGYSSGIVRFGRGVFALAADTFEITQDAGLQLVGSGWRGTQQALPGATTLLQKGSSSGFFFRHFGNAARSLTFHNLDLCYETSTFTGDMIDTYSSPGLSLNKVRVGCYGGFSATRVQTARSLIRATYDEFINVSEVVMDGAIDGFWSDTSRTLGGSTFGGWGTKLDAVTFYDFSGSMLKHTGERSRSDFNVIGSYFNPINISPVRAFDIDNIEGLNVIGCQFTPSTSSQPTEQWLRILSTTGNISSNTFSGPSAKVGTFGGVNPTAIEWSNNRVSCLTGLTLTSGVITGSGNEYSNADHGVDIAPVASLSLDIGPDIFKSGVLGNSYRISADSTLLGGRINYSAEQDTSNSRFTNASPRITIENTDKRITTVASLPSTGSPFASGRTYNVTVAGTFTLPTPVPGTRLRVMKTTATALVVVTTGGSNFTTGGTATRTTATSTTAEVGSGLEFVALNTTSWVLQVLAGTWTFS